VRISARADYAIRAAVELAVQPTRTVKAETLASAQDIPLRFLLNILVELRRSGIVRSIRGPEGGYRLSRAASAISLADIIRSVEGPLAQVGDYRPEEITYQGSAEPLRQVWVAVRSNLRAVLESVSVADVQSNDLPPVVTRLASQPDAWAPH
jgi:Rrf2 family protein